MLPSTLYPYTLIPLFPYTLIPLYPYSLGTLIPHPYHFRALFTFVLFLIEPPVMVLGLHYHGGPSPRPVAAGW